MAAGWLLVGSLPASADDWPQWLGAARDGVWRESGLIDKFPAGGPKVLWRTQLGVGYAGPAVVGDAVYVMDLERAVDAEGKPRRATRQGLPGSERVLCYRASSGEPLWKHAYDCPYTISYPGGPRTTPLVEQGRVYSLGAMGDLLCLDAADGKVHWSKKLTEAYSTEPPVWGYASHLLVDGDLLYTLAGGAGSAIVALDKHTGNEVWRALSTEEVGYSPPMIYQLAGRRQLIVWLSEAIYGLDPASGKQIWKLDYPLGVPVQRPAVNIITVKQAGDALFVSTFYHGPMMITFQGDTPSVAWKGKSNNPVKPDGAHCLMASPVFADGLGYACGSNGEFLCFESATGAQKWQTFEPTLGKRTDCGTVFCVPHASGAETPNGTLHTTMFNDQGELILAQLSKEGYQQIDRARILEPVGFARGRDIVWSHPAFARKCVFARNDKELVCVSLAVDG
ncbi:MAG: PQQ-binding-like beta-propeller repeat protein [Pirellulales bacterium]